MTDGTGWWRRYETGKLGMDLGEEGVFGRGHDPTEEVKGLDTETCSMTWSDSKVKEESFYFDCNWVSQEQS